MPMEWMAPLMFAGLVIVMLIGFPVAFSLAALGLLSGFVSIELGFFPAQFMANLPLRVFGILSNDLLLAIPFFTFMGAILERCGLAEDLLEGTGQLFGGVPGGLAYAVILVGAILGAITGTVAASVIAMGVISLPIMMRYGYDMRLATGVIAASGTITQVIPPSLVLVVLADQLGRSVGDMYAGAIGPSIAQILIFLAYILVLSLIRPQSMPPLPPEARTQRGWVLWRRVLWGMVPSIVLIFLVLGTIFLGVATPTEAGAMGAVGALVLAALHRRLSWPLVRQGMDSTMRITAMVIFILIGSTVFSLVFQGVDGGIWIEHMLTKVTGGSPTAFLIVVNIFVFFLAFFLDFFEIAFIIIPLLAPVADKLGIDLIWFGVLLCVNMQTSFMHPPFGFALFYLRGIAPKEIKSADIYLGAIPWVAMQLILVAILIFWPGLVTMWIDKPTGVDPSTIQFDIKGEEAAPGGEGGRGGEPSRDPFAIPRDEAPASDGPPATDGAPARDGAPPRDAPAGEAPASPAGKDPFAIPKD
ncbi:MAG TPA: TRAP transporter large permease subunit [Burkholderiaceae bacterium]|nr:TRAP transporter large permease subunit [Burkholderiaceae bacterium]